MITSEFALFFAPGSKLFQHGRRYFLQIPLAAFNPVNYYLQLFCCFKPRWSEAFGFYWSEIDHKTFSHLSQIFTAN